MPDRDNRQVAEQNAAYRRGVVLGLTMAEAGILIIFVLLLLIGFDEWADVNERQDRVLVTSSRFQELERADRLLAPVHEALRLPVTASDEEIRTMVRAVLESAATPAGQSSLEEARVALDEMQRIRDEMRAAGYPADVTSQVEKQAFRIANQEGQLKLYEDKLQDAGLGKGERPCWVKPDGTIEFLFDVVLASNGIKMRENLLPGRDKERATLPIPFTTPDEVLTERQFLERTLPLYKSSLAANCRFFVTIYDATGPVEKELYKSLLRTVEGHFYKRLSLDRAPF